MELPSIHPGKLDSCAHRPLKTGMKGKKTNLAFCAVPQSCKGNEAAALFYVGKAQSAACQPSLWIINGLKSAPDINEGVHYSFS